MSRKLRKVKPLIYVFCEGESEQAYTDFLKNKFSDVAVIKQPASPKLFEEAKACFSNEPKYRNSIEETDEIWFFFDVETKDVNKWDHRMKIVNSLRKFKKKPGIHVRLLMTTGCIEYWLMLHYKMYTPSLQSVPEKERVIAELKAKEPAYSKGNYRVTAHIAENYPTAVVNAARTVRNLLSEGLPEKEETDERNKWLYTQCKTFSTVYEAINYIESLRA